jgi:hypothetical protein
MLPLVVSGARRVASLGFAALWLVTAGCAGEKATERTRAATTSTIAGNGAVTAVGNLGGTGLDSTTTLPIPIDDSATTTPQSPLAASTLNASSHCGPIGTHTAAADLSWSPATTSGSGQKVELTTVQNGFTTGKYESSPPLPASATSYTWPTVNPLGVHTWRVATLHGSEWVPSPTHQFTGPVCAGDVANPPG